MGGTRFNNVGNISFKNASSKILNGGVMIYRGDKGDGNVRGIYSSSKLKFNSNECQYMTENGGNDFGGNKVVNISITNICIELNEVKKDDTQYIEMVEQEYDLSIYAESRYEDFITINFLGMNVLYNGKSALLGYAVYQGKIANDRFNDCDRIILRFDNDVAIQGGYLHYTGNYDDWNMQGTLSAYSNKIGDTFTYYADDCRNDFPGKEASTTTIYICGICLLIV